MLINLKILLVGKTFISGIDSIEKNTKITYEQLENLDAKTLLNVNIRDEKTISDIELRTKNYDIQLGNINQKFENKIDKIQSGDELLPGGTKIN